MERFRRTCRGPSFLMKVDVDVQRSLRLSRRSNAVEPHVECFWKLPKVSSDVLADALTQRRQIRFPGVATEVDVRADVALLLRHDPGPSTQLFSQCGGCARSASKLAEL